MKIEPCNEFVPSHKQFSLDENLTAAQITKLLGGIKSKGPSGDGKCKYQWDFYADGQQCSIWDYKGARWSGYGSLEAFHALGMLRD